MVNDEMRGGVPPEQLYRSGYDHIKDPEYYDHQARRNRSRHQDLDQRSLPEEFDVDDDDDDCLSRDAEMPKANLRLKNSEVSRLFNMHMPGYGLATHGKPHHVPAPFQLDESNIPATVSNLD